MAFTSNGLPNGGLTPIYQFRYDDSLAMAGIEPNRLFDVIFIHQVDFDTMTDWFRGVTLDVNLPINVDVTPNHGDFGPNSVSAGWDHSPNNDLRITINAVHHGQAMVRYLLVAEMVEQFMRAQGTRARGPGNWFGRKLNGSETEGSLGEGLSQFLGAQFLIGSVNEDDRPFGLPPVGSEYSNEWLNSARDNFVNNPDPTDSDKGPKSGCACLFIYYLFVQLGFSVEAIVAAGAKTLTEVYRNLTGDSADPFPFFKQVIDNSFPGVSTITSGNRDNPFPLPTSRILSVLQFLKARHPGLNNVRTSMASDHFSNMRGWLNSARAVSLLP